MKNRLTQNRVGLAVFAAGLLFMAVGAYRQEIGWNRIEEGEV